MKNIRLFSHLTAAALVLAMGVFTFGNAGITSENTSLVNHSNDVTLITSSISNIETEKVIPPTSLLVVAAVTLTVAVTAMHHEQNTNLALNSKMTEEELQMNLLP